jgi:hypothetical protein
MLKKILGYFTLLLLLLLSSSSGNSGPQSAIANLQARTGTFEKLIAVSGDVAIDLDLNRLDGAAAKESRRETLRFAVAPDSFFTIRVFNDSLRGADAGLINLVRRNSAVLPEALNASSNQLDIEKLHASEPYDLAVRDGKTGFVFFNIEGNLYDYDAATRSLSIKGGRLLISEEFARTMGRPADTGLNVGRISIGATMSPIEVTTLVNGATRSSKLPARGGGTSSAPEGSVPGPDIIVGDMSGLQHFGSSGTQVGLATGATSCNNGNVPFHFYQLPDPDHSVVSQNLYRMSGGSSNDERFEQLGQSWNKHTFGASQENACSFGCTPFPDASELGVGCSDPYSAGQNGFQGNTNSGALGSRAWINPFTGIFPVSPRPENHTGHTHTGTSHRILVNANDLNTTMNTGATYYLEVQYDSPQEYAWCQTHPGECNMYNNASYRRYNVTGTTGPFTFVPVGSTVRMTPATGAWTGATSSTIEPAPGVDGRAFVVYKVTNPSAGVWHYEYAIHNQNLDRSIQSFSVPLGCGITLSNLGFHAPPNHPGFPNDGTLGSAGFSNAAWTSNQTSSALSWNTETFAQNQNANAIRFGTLYNFRFDSNRPPQGANATIGFFKTGAPITVAIQGPTPDTCAPLQVTSAVSRKTHGGAGDFDIALPLTGAPGVECRSSGGNHTFVITFTNQTVSGNASVTSGTGSLAGSPTFSGNTMTVNLTGVTDVQTLTVTLSGVTDNTAQVLPDTPVSAKMLVGDTNGSSTVNAGDIGQTKAQAGNTAEAGNFRNDTNVSGSINAGDISQVKASSGNAL